MSKKTYYQTATTLLVFFAGEVLLDFYLSESSFQSKCWWLFLVINFIGVLYYSSKKNNQNDNQTTKNV